MKYEVQIKWINRKKLIRCRSVFPIRSLYVGYLKGDNNAAAKTQYMNRSEENRKKYLSGQSISQFAISRQFSFLPCIVFLELQLMRCRRVCSVIPFSFLYFLYSPTPCLRPQHQICICNALHDIHHCPRDFSEV